MRSRDQRPRLSPGTCFAAALVLSLPVAAPARVLEPVQTVEGSRLGSAERVVLSPDGRHVYVAGHDGLNVFARDPASGRLRFVERAETVREEFVFSPDGRHLYTRQILRGLDRLETYERDPASGRLRLSESLPLTFDTPRTLAFSPDGRHLYAAGERAAVHVLERDAATGGLREAGELPRSDDFIGQALTHVVSPDGRHVYARGPSRLTVLARDSKSGALSFLGHHVDGLADVGGINVGTSALAMSPGGRHLYVSVFGLEDAVRVFEREPTTGALRHVATPYDDGDLALSGARAVAVGPGGDSVYVATVNENAVLAFARDPASGALAFGGAVVDGEGGADGLDGANSLAPSPDGRHLYAAGFRDGAVALLATVGDGGLAFVEARFSGDDGFAGLGGAVATAVSPGGEHVYAAAGRDRTVAALARHPGRGILTPIAAYDVAPGVVGPPAADLALSPDGEHLYVASGAGIALLGSLSVFARDPATGTLSFVESYGRFDDGLGGLIGAGSVIVTSDGRHVYVGGAVDLVALARDPATGTLDPVRTVRLGGLIEDSLTLAASPDGRHLYAASHVDGFLTALSRGEDGVLGHVATYSEITGAPGLDGAISLTVSPDGRHLYVASLWHGVAAFARDGATGRLLYVASYSDADPGLAGLAGARGVAVSPGGDPVYVAGSFDHAVAVLRRHPATGALSLLEVHRDGAFGVDGLAVPTSVSVSPDGRNVYLTSNLEDAVTVFRRREGPCADRPGIPCLGANRFRVELEWRDFRGNRGAARTAPFGSSDAGLFWFFDASNWEMLVKVLDGCAINGRFWVFAAATTDVAYTLRVTDELTGVSRTYSNPLGRASPALTDTGAFATCEAGEAAGPPQLPAASAAGESLLPLPRSIAVATGTDRVDTVLHPGAAKSPGPHLLVGLGGKCLDVQGGATIGVTPVNVFRCHAEANQRWDLVEVGSALEVRDLQGRCLQTEGDAGPRARLVVGFCGLGDRWELDGDRESFRLVHQESGLCLDVEGAGTADRTPVQLFGCHGGANQTWRAEEILCRESSTRSCLNRSRFEVEVEWQDFDGNAGRGRAVALGGGDSGLFWFFDEQNLELLVKVLDGCDLNRRYWVFAAATTDVGYVLRVTDTRTGAFREYHNELGAAADAVTDTDAFATCP